MKNKSIFKKISKFKFPIIMVILIIMVGTFVISGYMTYTKNYEKSINAYFDQNNIGDLWLKGDDFTVADLEKLRNMENINDAERFMRLTTRFLDNEEVKIETNFIETNNINKMEVFWGEEFTEIDHGIWINKEFAKKENLLIGDYITIKYQDHTLSEKIRGVINTPDHVGFSGDMYVYLDSGECCMEGAPFQNIVIDVDDYTLVDETITRILQELNVNEITKREDTEAYGSVKAEIERMNNELQIVIIATIVAAVLMLLIIEAYVIITFRKEYAKKLDVIKKAPKKEVKLIADILFGTVCFAILIANILGTICGGNYAIDRLKEKFVPDTFISPVEVLPSTEIILAIAIIIMAGIVSMQFIETKFGKKK